MNKKDKIKQTIERLSQIENNLKYWLLSNKKKIDELNSQIEFINKLKNPDEQDKKLLASFQKQKLKLYREPNKLEKECTKLKGDLCRWKIQDEKQLKKLSTKYDSKSSNDLKILIEWRKTKVEQLQRKSNEANKEIEKLTTSIQNLKQIIEQRKANENGRTTK